MHGVFFFFLWCHCWGLFILLIEFQLRKKKITINFSQNFSGNELQSVERFAEFFLFLACNMCLSCVKADYFLPSPEYHKFFCKINKALSRISEITRGSPCLRSKMHITARPSATSKLSVTMKCSTNRQSTEKTLTSHLGEISKKKNFAIQATLN